MKVCICTNHSSPFARFPGEALLLWFMYKKMLPIELWQGLGLRSQSNQWPLCGLLQVSAERSERPELVKVLQLAV